MRIVLTCALIMCLCVMITGCATMPWPGSIHAPLNVGTKSAGQMVDNTAGTTKIGESEAEGIILVGFGDASIATAMNNGGITKVHHVDTEEFNIFGIYSRKKTIVYGE